MKNFKINIASLPDREKLVLEIWYKNEQVAEINQETDEFFLEIYPPKKGNSWKFNLKEFQKIIDKGMEMLKK